MFIDARGGCAGTDPKGKTGTDDVVILVHGTFARGAPWTHADSLIAKAVQAELPFAKVVSFQWSGANSHSARIDAGSKLARFGNLLRDEGCQRIWIVSHSHGGNVALYALRDPLMRESVAGIVFLGTPFLQITEHQVDRFAAIFTKTASWFLLFPVFAPFGAMGLISVADALVGPIAGGIFLVFGNGLIGAIYLVVRGRLQRAACRSLTALLRHYQEHRRVKLLQPVPSCPTFIASVRRDEAGLLLRVLDTITFAPWQAFAFVSRLIATVTVTFVAVYLGVATYDDTLANTSFSDYGVSLILSLALFVIVGPVLISIINGVVRGAPFAFGYEGFLGGATLRIKPVSTPAWALQRGSQQLGHTPSRDLRRLRHSSFYSDPTVVRTFVSWFAALADRLPSESAK